MMNFHALDTKAFNNSLNFLIAADNILAVCFEYIRCIGKIVHFCESPYEVTDIIGFAKQRKTFGNIRTCGVWCEKCREIPSKESDSFQAGVIEQFFKAEPSACCICKCFNRNLTAWVCIPYGIAIAIEIPVGAVARRVLPEEATDDRIIISGTEIIGPGLLVIILPGVAEGVGIGGNRIFLVAEGVVGVGLGDSAGSVGQVGHITVAVVQVVHGSAARGVGHQAHAVDILARSSTALEVQDDMVTIIEVLGGHAAGGLGEAQAGGEVVEGAGSTADDSPVQLTEGVVAVRDGSGGGAGILLSEVAVGVVGIGGGAGGAALGLGLGGELVGLVVGVGAADANEIEVFLRGVPRDTPLDCIGLGFDCRKTMMLGLLKHSNMTSRLGMCWLLLDPWWQTQ